MAILAFNELNLHDAERRIHDPTKMMELFHEND